MKRTFKRTFFALLLLCGCYEPDPSEQPAFLGEATAYAKHQPPPTAKPGSVTFALEQGGAQVCSASVSATVNLFARILFATESTRTATAYVSMPNGSLWSSGVVDIVRGEGWLMIPVGGTPIQDRQLVGTWCVQANLDDGISIARGCVELGL